MNKVKRAVHEGRRLLHDYWRALAQDIEGRPTAIIPCLYRIFSARTRFGVGPLYYALYQFSRIPSGEWENYVTDDPDFKQFLRDMSPPSMQRLVQNKALLYEHCIRQNLPTIPILCMVGVSPDPTGPAVRSASNIDQWLQALQAEPGDLFVKPIDGTYGEGSFAVCRMGADSYSYEGQTGSLSDVYRHLLTKLDIEDGWIVQPRLGAHSQVAELASPNGLATIRMVTTIKEGVARLVVAAFKLTVGDNITDNFSKGKSGNLLAAIDIESGTLSSAWGSTRNDWPVMEAFKYHPDTGSPIQGSQLPLWEEVVDTALRAQQSLPQLASAGWDIAITDRGVMLVEANLTYDLSILQIAHQRGLKKQIFEALGRSGGPKHSQSTGPGIGLRQS